MKRILCFCMLVLSVVSGCASGQSYIKPGVDFCEYRKIAVIALDCPANPAIGQEVADTIALEFLKKGYHVIERSQLRAIINEEVLKLSGLTEESKRALQVSGVSGVVVGSVSRYDCVPSRVFLYLYGSGYYPLNTNKCHASLSVKMLHVETGEVVWMANGAHSMEDINMTASKVLQKVMRIICKNIPQR